MLIASIYEQEAELGDRFAALQSALDMLKPLINHDSPRAENLLQYVQLLVRQIERSGSVDDASAETDKQKAFFVEEAMLQIDKLEAVLKENPAIESRSLPVQLRVRVLAAYGRSNEAQETIRQLANQELESVKTDADRGKLLLQLGAMASIAKQYSDAEEYYRQLLSIAPNSYVLLVKSLSDQKKYGEAVDLCLQVAPKRPANEIATLLMQILATAGNDKELEARAQPTINAAIESDRDNVDLLMSLAVRQVTEDKYDEAIKQFYRILDVQPNHLLALNNLATLLSERPNQLAEARKFVDRAIAISGRTPPLLDTLGTIEVRAGNPERAVAELEEAIAGAGNDPRYYFHLAVAYQRANREADAEGALNTARKYGLDRAILTVGDRELLSSLEKHLLTETHK
jgi:tetratricopeptide (TPR) repeat protein